MSDGQRRETTLFILLPSEVATVGLTVALSSRSELHVLGTALSLESGLAALRRLPPEVVIVNPEWVQEVRQFLTETGLQARVIAFGSKPHLGASAAATGAVACGYVSYFTPGRTYLPLIDEVSRCRLPTLDADEALCRTCPVRQSLKPPRPNLTAREMQVFTAIGKGFSTSEIAADMGISVKTVESHRESIKSKLATGSAWELNAMAADWCRGGSS